MADLALNIRIRAINEAGSAVRGLASDFRDIQSSGRKISAQSRRGRGIGQIGKQARSASDSLGDAARGASDLGRSAQRLVGGPLDAVTKYETALTDIKTLSGAASISTEQLADITSEAAAQFGGSAIDQAGAFYDIISAGARDATEATQTLDAANKFAIGGLTSVKTATNAIAATTANFAQQQVDAAKASDLLFSIVDSGRTTAEKVAVAFPKVASAAGGVGIRAEEAAGAFALLTRNAGSTAQASTQLANLIAATQKPTAQATKALKELNASLPEDRQIRIDTAFLRDEGFAKFAKQFQGLDEGVLARLFGNTRARAAIIAFNQDIGALDTAIQSATNSTGKAAEAFAKQDKTRAQSLKRLEAQQEQIKLAFGDAILPIVDGLTPSFLSFAESAAKFTRDSPMLAKSVGLFSIGAIGLGKVGEGIISITKASRALGAVAGPAVRGVKALAASVGGFGALGLVGAAAAAGVAVGTLIDRFLGISDFVASLNQDPFFEKLNKQPVATTQTQIVERKRGRIAELDKLIEDGGVIDTLSGRTEARIRERTRLRSELSRLTQGGSLRTEDQLQSRSVLGGISDTQGGQALPERVQVQIRVDQDGRVSKVDAGGTRGVRADVGEGLATG